MEKEIQKRSIINVLRNMDVGDEEVFPITQKTSVVFTLNQRLYKEKGEGTQQALEGSTFEIRIAVFVLTDRDILAAGNAVS